METPTGIMREHRIVKRRGKKRARRPNQLQGSAQMNVASAANYAGREWSGIAQAGCSCALHAGAVAGFAQQFDVRDALASGPGR
jgi:hypothetical protein